MKQSNVDVLIVGAGPAGLAAAIALKKSGIAKVRVVERESYAGGIPRHSHHIGYGIRDLKRFISGPKYADSYVKKAKSIGVEISTNTTATNWISDYTLQLTSPNGIEEVSAKSILLATGARERSRSNRLIAGKRPAGIYTTGSLQQATYLDKLKIGTKAVIVGAEHVSFSAIITLRHAKVKTVAMITTHPKHQTLPLVPTLLKLIYRFKFIAGVKIIEVLGDKSVTGIRIEKDGKEQIIAADTIVFTGDWIPDHELARKAKFAIDDRYKSPITNSDGQLPKPMVYAVGNLLLPIKAADKCANEGKKIGKLIAKKLNKR
jgi:thioredoxin reductase